MCAYCQRFATQRRDGEFCTAYPDGTGIPREILDSKVDHRKPYPGDHGLQFKQRSDMPDFFAGGWTPATTPTENHLSNEWTPIGVNVYCATGPGGGKDPTCSPGKFHETRIFGGKARVRELDQSLPKLDVPEQWKSVPGQQHLPFPGGQTTQVAQRVVYRKLKARERAEKLAQMSTTAKQKREEKLAQRREKARIKREARPPEEAEASRVKREARRAKYKAGQEALKRVGGGQAPPTPPPAGTHEQAGTLPDSDQRTELEHQTFKSRKDHGGGIEKTETVVLGDGTKGLYKPESGENTDPEGRRFIHGYKWAREVMTSVAASLFGMDDLVPVTVDHDDGHGGHGALRRYVDNADAAADMGIAAQMIGKIFDGKKDLARAAAFDFAIGNEDRHTGNWLVTKGTDPKLVLIDHGYTFPSRNEKEWGNYMIGHEAKDLEIPEEARHWIDKWSQVERHMKALGFRKVEIEAAHDRIKALSNKKYKKFSDLKNVWDNGRGYKAAAEVGYSTGYKHRGSSALKA
jgi:hypothetical protein